MRHKSSKRTATPPLNSSDIWRRCARVRKTGPLSLFRIAAMEAGAHLSSAEPHNLHSPPGLRELRLYKQRRDGFLGSLVHDLNAKFVLVWPELRSVPRRVCSGVKWLPPRLWGGLARVVGVIPHHRRDCASASLVQRADVPSAGREPRTTGSRSRRHSANQTGSCRQGGSSNPPRDA